MSVTVTFLGTNGWFDSETGSTTCVVAETRDCIIVMDAGFGLARLDRAVALTKPTYIFLSHIHLDHVVGLHTLAKFSPTAPVTIVAAAGYLPLLRGFIAQPWTMPPSGLSFPLKFAAIRRSMTIPGVTVRCLSLPHAAPCLGYRFDCGGKILSYCTDTGPCPQVVTLGRQADLLITECALQAGEDDNGWPHLDPLKAARLAQQAQARQLILTHFDAHAYSRMAQRRRAQQQARTIFPDCRVARDGLQVRL